MDNPDIQLLAAVGSIRPYNGSIVSECTAFYEIDGVPHVEYTVRLG